MRRKVRQRVIFAILLACSMHTKAQLELITIEQPFHAKSLAGVLSDPSGAAVDGVVVEECDSTYKSVLASVTTGTNGHFALPSAKNGTTHFLRLRHYGFDPMQITVKIGRFARGELNIQLHIAN